MRVLRQSPVTSLSVLSNVNNPQVRFFTQAPDTSNSKARANAEAEAQSLDEEKTFGDLVFLDIDRGMNFGARLVAVMKSVSASFTFDFFLKLDDDYFLCLSRLLGELELIQLSRTVALNGTEHRLDGDISSPPLYMGYRHCLPGNTRIDEAYLRLSSSLVDSVISAPHLVCTKYKSMTVGWWFTKGNPLNPNGNIQTTPASTTTEYGGILKKAVGHLSQLISRFVRDGWVCTTRTPSKWGYYGSTRTTLQRSCPGSGRKETNL